MNEQLLLTNIRNVLARIEETIIFSLIERAQFKRNSLIYAVDALGAPLKGHSLVGYILHETERIHSRLRRYTSPDEHPFFPDLPSPILPSLSYDENPLVENDINLNDRVRQIYENDIIPHICHDGDDKQYGSSALCDVNALQALSRRIHYGKFVAEGKYRSAPELFDAIVATGDRDAIFEAITDEVVEAAVLERVRLKAEAYGRDYNQNDRTHKINPDAVVSIYSEWVIPLNKEVQVQYLLVRGRQAES